MKDGSATATSKRHVFPRSLYYVCDDTSGFGIGFERRSGIADLRHQGGSMIHVYS